MGRGGGPPVAWRWCSRWAGRRRGATGTRVTFHTGNPFYPAAFLFWPGATFPDTTLREYARHYGVGRAMGDALVVYLNWPRFHAWLAITGLAGLAAWMAGGRRR